MNLNSPKSSKNLSHGSTPVPHGSTPFANGSCPFLTVPSRFLIPIFYRFLLKTQDVSNEIYLLPILVEGAEVTLEPTMSWFGKQNLWNRSCNSWFVASSHATGRLFPHRASGNPLKLKLNWVSSLAFTDPDLWKPTTSTIGPFFRI